jgi:hypothetical protein
MATHGHKPREACLLIGAGLDHEHRATGSAREPL